MLGDTVIQIALSVFGMIGGPLCGVVTLALFFPCCNAIVSNCHINKLHTILKCMGVFEESCTSMKYSLLIAIQF